ncbi:MAG: aminoacyl-tRNA hydrolase [Pirellulaceae bacterium]
MKIIVGLGNPGKKYQGTRHNIGFDVIQRLADRWGVARFQAKHDAEIGETLVGSEKVLLVRPLTYMNLSGNSVKPLVDFFQLPLSELLIICDDLALPPGKIRLRGQGSSGGQKGLQNICDRMGTQTVPRVRIGIGETPEHWETSDFVLSKFTKFEQDTFDAAVEIAANAAEEWVRNGLLSAMNRFNGETNPQSS